MIKLMVAEGLLISFVFGLIYGSFLNVVILRFDDWISILKGRSHCPECKTELRWFDLVPLLSYVLLRGRCRYCQKPISWQYPIVEFATAALVTAGFHLIFLTNDFPLWQSLIVFVAYLLAIGSLIAIFFHDLYEMMVPESMAYLFLVSAFIFSIFYHGSFLNALYGGLVGLIPIALLVYPSRGELMGEGDVKIAAGLGLLAGWPAAIVFLALAFIIGALFGLVMMVASRAKLKTAVPFAPFLILGGLISLFWGQAIVYWYLRALGYV